MNTVLHMTPDHQIAPGPADNKAKVEIKDLSFFYGPSKALKNISLPLIEHKVTAFIGPSGCGKSTLLRCLNRMNDLIDGTRVARGSIRIRGVVFWRR